MSTLCFKDVIKDGNNIIVISILYLVRNLALCLALVVRPILDSLHNPFMVLIYSRYVYFTLYSTLL